MSELEDSNGPVPRDEVHERWLAMQSAYEEYMRASEVFENTRELTRDLTDLGRYELTLLDGRRDAFERYLEARMEFLECRFDEGYRREAAMASRPTRETGGLRTVSLVAGPKWLIPVLAVGILSATVFSFVREHKHVRDLDLARDQLRASLSDTREQLQLLTEKLDARESTERSAVRQVEPTAEPPAPAPQIDGRKPSGGTGWRRLPEPITKTTSRAARTYFSLSRSSQFKRVGPIIVSLKSVDVRRNSVDVSIVSESGKVDVQHLKLNQPVWIKRSYRGQLLELEADRITANGISGHLIELHG
jgi:hypothetical protein